MGVKSLWKLLAPVGRPVMLETLEGQILAIDSSIWIYQFQATMRDKDGRALSNAHILGFLRRIAKLLFYGIRPVFVFDGGAPALKRNTLNERKHRKAGAAISHAKLAEKLLAAQLRREAVNQAKGTTKTAKGKSKVPSGPVVLDDKTVYLEDIDGSVPKTPATKATTDSSSVSPSKPRFHDHDPHRLPDIDFEAAIANATRAAIPDPRLATEEELREFIEDMRPEDFDVTSPAFRELPTEVQYEIVGDLRLKSRQTSYARLQNMLQNSHTPLDFSKQQILNLRQRNTLTQQLLTTTDSIGKAHLTIPVRVASERNREYVLIKNEGVDGGWILGIRDDGTKEKPIEIDQDDDNKQKSFSASDGGDSDEDMEEVSIPAIGVPDPDLQEYQRSMTLGAIANRQVLPKKSSRPKTTLLESTSRPLFDVDDDSNDVVPIIEDDDDGELALAIQASMDQASVGRPVPPRPQRPVMVNAVASSSKVKLSDSTTTPRRTSAPDSIPRYSFDDDFVHGNRLETQLSIANARPGPSRTPTKATMKQPATSSVTEAQPDSAQAKKSSPSSVQTPPKASTLTFGEPLLLQSKIQSPTPAQPSTPVPLASTRPVRAELGTPANAESGNSLSFGKPFLLQQRPVTPVQATISQASPPSPSRIQDLAEDSDEDMEMEEVLPVFTEAVPEKLTTIPQLISSEPQSFLAAEELVDGVDSMPVHVSPPLAVITLGDELASHPNDPVFTQSVPLQFPIIPSTPSPELARTESLPTPHSSAKNHAYTDIDEPVSDWSRSPSPVVGLEQSQPREPSPVHESWDAVQEMDVDAEEGEFARFISQVKGKDLEQVRQEIDDEIKVLNTQKKAAMRDSDDINQQMVSQIMMMLSLFGIPYITAPMEAEAQCAELVQLGLVNGVITDDSDVFLFGGLRVFKNMFNQSKTVECFLLADLSRELGLDRDTLIRLAYLLGSDYVEGLLGVGPVVAMELLDEFPGEDGLHKFKDWWTKVQSGKDRPEDNKSKFRKRFKKKFKDLYLAPDWPNALVRDAYYHPTVDESEEPFKWGQPDLDALREFLYVELSWSPDKVDELLLPVIQKMHKRAQTGALNKQGNLNGFFDVSGSGTIAPRKRQAYASKRLQQVVSDFRKKRKHSSKSPAEEAQNQDAGSVSEGDSSDPSPKKKARAPSGKGKAASTRGSGRGRGRGRGRGGKKASSRRKAASEDEASASDFEGVDVDAPGHAPKLRPRPKPAYKGATAVIDPTAAP